MEREPSREELDQERESILAQLRSWLELPMIVLAFVWLALFVVEVLWGLSPFLAAMNNVIWGLFVVDFLISFLLAPSKLAYLRRDWLKALALLAPALRLLRVVRVLRLAGASRALGMTRGLRLLRVLSSINRGMRALGASMSRRGAGYVALLTLIVVVVGAAGMYAFEGQDLHGRGLGSYSEALWWTAMLITTIGSDYWPVTAGGRLLCLFLSIYSIAVLGYITATLATFFIGRDAEDEAGEVAGAAALAELQAEIAALRQALPQGPGGPRGPAAPPEEAGPG